MLFPEKQHNIMFTFKLVYSDLFPPLKNVSKQERYNSFRFEYISFFRNICFVGKGGVGSHSSNIASLLNEQ